MAKNDNKAQPFNLLYRFEPQKSSVDKVYEFVVYQGRIIVMFIMLIIILAFAYRFPLDRKLNDQINLSEENLRRLNFYSNDSMEQNYNETVSRTTAAKNFINIYNTANPKENQVKIGDFLKLVRKINEEQFKDDISIDSFTYTADPILGSTLNITGITSAFPKGEAFRGKLVEQIDYVDQTTMQMAASQRGTIEFTLQIQLKN